MPGKLEAGETSTSSSSGAAAAEDWKQFKRAMFHVSFFLSVGMLFTLLSFLVPGASMRFQILCWQTAAVCFASVVDVVWRYRPVFRSVLRGSGEPKPGKKI